MNRPHSRNVSTANKQNREVKENDEDMLAFQSQLKKKVL